MKAREGVKQNEEELKKINPFLVGNALNRELKVVRKILRHGSCKNGPIVNNIDTNVFFRSEGYCIGL
jgi:hypothetical protein